MVDRRELDELYRVHDQMMAEARSNDSSNLVFKITERPTPEAVYTTPSPDVTPSPGDDQEPNLFEALEAFQNAVTNKIDDFDRGRVDTLIVLLAGGKAKSVETIDLPNWRNDDAAQPPPH